MIFPEPLPKTNIPGALAASVGGAAGPAWEDKALTAHSPEARTKVLNKKIHLDVHPWETLVNWEIVGVKRTRRSGVGGSCRGEPQNVSVLIFSHLRRGKEDKALFGILKKLCCLFCQNIPSQSLRGPPPAPFYTGSKERGRFARGPASLPGSHSLALISNCFSLIFVCVFKDQENERRKQRSM